MTTLDERHGLVEAQGPVAVPLDQPLAALPLRAGSKAANLARAASAGLPVLPGFVVPGGAHGDPAALWPAWQELSEGGARPLVVRSSSPQEDTGSSSLAGQFASVLDVRGWADFGTAVQAVLDSARRPDGTVAPMAVLVQPMLTARVGGVMFGADPVAGRADRMLVSAVRGGPDRLVGGEQAGSSYWLSRHGRPLRTEPADAGDTGVVLTRGQLLRLARLAQRARRVFGGPQDIEFGFDGDGRLWLFQSRPITAMAAPPARGARLFGPGPVAETLPGQLLPLEADLRVTPMARGLAAALDIGGSAPRRLLRRVPVVTTVGGRAAADLRLLGAAPPAHRWLALLNPAPGARRLAAAWRLGRLSAALPGLATDLVADVDRRPAEVPAPARLPASGLAAELRWTRPSRPGGWAAPGRVGLSVVRLPVRDGQTPRPAQVRRFLEVVAAAPGRVFVHCGAGVGRTGTMAAAYLVQSGEQSPVAAVRRNLAVGPPSIEQIYYGLSLGRDRLRQPPFPVVAVSRLVDAPRRMWSWL